MTLPAPPAASCVSIPCRRWEVDEVLVSELARNLLLALAMVSLTSLVLLADLRATVLVLASVILTLVDVVGLMYYWGIR